MKTPIHTPLPSSRTSSSIEPLEARIAPATLNVAAGVLTYTAGAGIANSLTFSVSGANYMLIDTSEAITLTAGAIAAGFSNASASIVSGPDAAVSSIAIVLGDMDDVLGLQGANDSVTAVGGSGTDSITVSGPLVFSATGSTLRAETVTVSGTISGAASIAFNADNLAIGAAVTSSFRIVVATDASGRTINLGTNVGTSTSLTDAELDLFTAPTVKIGDSASGAITVSTLITPAGAGTLSLRTTGGVTATGAGAISVANLAIDADASVTLNGANNVTALAIAVTDADADIALTDATGFQIATVDGIVGITAGPGINGNEIRLQAGATTQATGASILGSSLVLLGSGPFTLNSAGNDVTEIVADITGALSFTDADSLNVGSVTAPIFGITTVNNPITITTISGGILIFDDLAGADVDAGSGAVSLTAGSTGGADSVLNIQANAGVTGTGGVTLIGDNITIAATVNAGASTATLRPSQNGTLINLGGADAAGTLGLTDAELDLITAGRIVVGSTTSGTINLTGAISPAGTTFLQLRTGGAITESNLGTDITETSLTLEAATGIATAGNLLEIAVANLEAQTTTGGLFLSATGALTIGGIDSALPGLRVVTSGDLTLSTTGTITLADVSSGEIVRGGNTSGNVTLTATGAASDITATVNNDAIVASGGSIAVTAGRDIIFGTSMRDNDVDANLDATLTAGRDVIVDGSANVRSSAFANNTGNSVSITAGRDISILNGAPGLASVNALGTGGGDVTLTTGTNGVFTLTATDADALRSVTGDVTVNADRIVIGATANFTAPAGIVTLQPATAGRLVNLGSATDAAANTLELSDAELDRITTPTLRIGSTASGALTLSAAISPTTATTLALISSAGIAGAGSIAVANLRADASASISLGGANDVDVFAAKSANADQSLTFTDTDGFTIGTVDGLSGISIPTGGITTLSGPFVSQAASGNILSPRLALLGTGPFILENPGNDADTLAANITGVLSYIDADALTIGTAGATSGITTSNSAISIITVDGAIAVNDTKAGSDVSAGTGTVTLTAGSAAGQDRALTLAANAGVTGTSGVTLVADNISLGAAVNAGSANVSIRAFEAATLIKLGSADTAGSLGLTDAELDFITAGTLEIGRTSGVSILVSAAISPSGVGTLSLTGSSIGGAGGITVAKLRVTGNTSIALDGANDVDVFAATVGALSFADADGFSLGVVDGTDGIVTTGTTIAALNAGTSAVTFESGSSFIVAINGTTPGTQHDQLAITGTVNLNGATLVPTLNFTPTGGDEVVLIANDGIDAVSGTFAGIAEGAPVTLGGQVFFLSYAGGDGNDVALTVVPLAVTLVNATTVTFTDVDGDLVTVKTTKGAFDGSEFLGIQTRADGAGQLQTLKLDGDFKGANITITAKRTAAGGNGFVNLGFLDAAGVDLGAVSIAGDLGRINAGTVGGDAKVPALKSLTAQSIGLLGTSTQDANGDLTSSIEGALPKLTVKGDLRGSLVLNGMTDGKLGTATIGGSFVGFEDLFAEAGIGLLKIAGDIRAVGGTLSIGSSRGPIGAMTVGGGIVGESASNNVIIGGFGQLIAPAKGTDIALKSLAVKGSVENTLITAGFGNLPNADASIGAISVGGDWIASAVVAGAGAGADLQIGTNDDMKFSGGGIRDKDVIFSTIGSFTVKGQALGTAGTTTDMFGIVAERIGKAKVGGRTFAFVAGTNEAFFAAPTLDGAGTENPAFDFTIRELGSTTPTVALGGPTLDIFTDGKTATFTDVDGDLVTLTRSAGTFVTGDFTIITAASGGGLLQGLTITPALDGKPINLTITAKVGPAGGNGFVNVGKIDADQTDLGIVIIGGELQDLDTGNNNAGKPGLGSLTVHSLGAVAGTAPTGDEINSAHGIGAIKVATDIRNFHIFANSSNTGNLGSLTVGGSMITAEVQAAANIGTIKIGGSFSGNQRIRATERIGAITVGGDFAGTIEAFAQDAGPAKGADLALKSFTVKGSVEKTNIVLGRNNNADASIGAISVGRAWIASSVLAGVEAGTDTFIGTADDQKGTLGGPIDLARFSTIASILIKGQAFGSVAGGDSFGIVAEEIGKAQIGAVKFALTKGARNANDAFAAAPTGPGATGSVSDFFLREVTL